MSLEDAIKEVAKAIQSHADAIREDIAQRKADTAALGQLMRVEYEEGYPEEDENEPAPVVSLAEKRKEKQAAEPLKEPLKTEFCGQSSTTEAAEFSGLWSTKDPEVEPVAMDMSEVNDALAEQSLDETMTEDYVIEIFKKAMLPKPGVSQEENKARVKDILKKYGGGTRLLDNNKITVAAGKWQDFTRELLS